MDFRPLDDQQRRELIAALRGNADHGVAILTDPRDTSFVGCSDDPDIEDTIRAIQSVPCHY